MCKFILIFVLEFNFFDSDGLFWEKIEKEVRNNFCFLKKDFKVKEDKNIYIIFKCNLINMMKILKFIYDFIILI